MAACPVHPLHPCPSPLVPPAVQIIIRGLGPCVGRLRGDLEEVRLGNFLLQGGGAGHKTGAGATQQGEGAEHVDVGLPHPPQD